MQKNRLKHIGDDLFAKATLFAGKYPDLAPPHQMLQKLTILDFVIPLLGKDSAQTILEIGSGLGIHSALLSHYGRVCSTELRIPGSFVGADREVQEIREKVFAELGTNDVNFRYHDGRHLPYDDQAFDVVFHNSVIEHVPDIEAFNAEVLRVLKPGGICICITGTPALCKFRLLRHYFLRFPLLLGILTAKECISPKWLHARGYQTLRALRVPASLAQKLVERLTRIDHRLDLLYAPISTTSSERRSGPDISKLYSRLYHYIYFPAYNQIVITKAAAECALTESQLLSGVREHFKRARNRMAFELAPATHGQHYHDVWHEMKEWRLERWKEHFSGAGFVIERIVGYRYHHVLEITPSRELNAKLYFWAAKAIHERIERNAIAPQRASEIILLARRPPAYGA